MRVAAGEAEGMWNIHFQSAVLRPLKPARSVRVVPQQRQMNRLATRVEKQT